ncbi:MAG: hypothetical protein EA349_12990 [Halomonadaceae bacterium]|nr:MAG: hypothetical protein EA349_12990 [Halomonadaceae bacterium]
MKCPTISDLQLDQNDEKALDAIRRAQRNGKMLERALPVGVMTTIFLGTMQLKLLIIFTPATGLCLPAP